MAPNAPMNPPLDTTLARPDELPMSAPRLTRRTSARSDLIGVLAVTLLTFVLSSSFQWHEKLALVALRFERWQLDELPLTLTALSLGLAWYAWRRRTEAAGLLAHNRDLAQQLIAVQDNERLALARELHDELGQHCTAIRLEAAYIQHASDAAQIAAASQRVSAAAEVLYNGVRRMLHTLRPAELDELGLVAALQALCDACEARSRVSCVLAHDGALDALGESIDTAVFRVTQEALSNVARHAQAASVGVRLKATRAQLVLEIEDDGRGFDAALRTRGLGLLGATERAAMLGGELQVFAAPGAGTRIRMQLPLPGPGPGAGRAR
jgi:signal transduction histidine kinase